MTELRRALDKQVAGLVFDEDRKAAVRQIAFTKRTRRPVRRVLIALALCAALAVTAAAAGPSIWQALEARLGAFAPYAEELDTVSVSQGVELRAVGSVSDGVITRIYLAATDLEGTRLDGHTIAVPQSFTVDGAWTNWIMGYGIQTVAFENEEQTLLLEIQAEGLDFTQPVTISGGTLQPGRYTVHAWPELEEIPAAALETELTEDGIPVLRGGQTPRTFEGLNGFRLSSMGFDERGRFHIRIALEPGYALEGRVYATASSADGRNWQEGMEVTMLPDGEDILLPAITRENVSELQELELYGAYTGPESPIQGEWSLSLELDTVNTWTTADSWSAACGGITITRVQLSPLGVVAWYSGEGWLHEAEYLQVEQKDGKSPTWEAPTGGGDQAGGCVIWAFNEPVEPEDISSVTIRGVEIPLS